MSRAVFRNLATTPEQPSSGYIEIYSLTDKVMYIMDDAGNIKKFGHSDSESKSLSLELPTASEDISLFFTNVAITVSAIVVALVGSASPSVTWTIRHSPDRSAAGNEVVTGGTASTSVTTGDEITSFDDATIPADSHVWLETTAKSGTVDSLVLSIFYNED